MKNYFLCVSLCLGTSGVYAMDKAILFDAAPSQPAMEQELAKIFGNSGAMPMAQDFTANGLVKKIERSRQIFLDVKDWMERLGYKGETGNPSGLALEPFNGTLKLDLVIALLALGLPIHLFNAQFENTLPQLKSLFRSLRNSDYNATFLGESFEAAIKGACLNPFVIIEDINAQDTMGMTALMWAAARDNKLLAQQLLALKASALIVDNNGDTALHIAVRAGHAEMVKYLYGHSRTALTKKNNQNKSPVDIAIAKGNTPLLKIMAQKVSK